MLDFKQLKDDGKEIAKKLVDVRRKIHQYPELGLKCTKTAALVEEKLSQLGLEVKTGYATTGIEAMLWGQKRKPVIAVRADMDALPIEEETGLPFSSKEKGKMHACGHDGHVAIVLGVAEILSHYRDQLPGSVKFIFQPGEEYPGAAKTMIEEGILENPEVDAMISGHIFPGIESGTLGVRFGALTARNDEFTVSIRGSGGHGAHPDKTQDPVVASSIFILKLQSIVSRIVDPVSPIAVNVGEISGGGGHNVVPKEIKLKGTIRSIDQKSRERAMNQIKKFLEGIKVAYDLEYDLKLVAGEPVLYCDDQLTRVCRDSLQQVLKKDKIKEIPNPSLGSEDCAFFSEEVPVVYFRFGSYDQKQGYVRELHTSEFDFDEDILPYNASLMSYVVSVLIHHFREG